MTTWAPVDLAGVFDEPEEAPSMLARSDGEALLYPGRLHLFHGEPESGKSWLALAGVMEQLRAGSPVVFLDFEDRAAGVVSRLQAMGTAADSIYAHLRYVRPDEMLTDEAARDLEAALADGPPLVVLDGMTEAFHLLGLDPLGTRDTAAFMQSLPRRAIRAGAAVILVDHVTKAREGRGRWALGSGHKLASIDGAAYSFEPVRTFGRGREGMARVEVAKDRPGYVRGFALGGRRVGDLKVISEGDAVTVRLDPPDAEGGGLSPSRARVLAVLGPESSPMDVQEIGDRLATDGDGPPLKARTIRKALSELVDLGVADGDNPGPPAAGRWWRT